MMKILFLMGSFFVSLSSYGQVIANISHIQPENNYENSTRKKLYTNTITVSSVVWIKNEVKLHKHAEQTVTQYVVEGEGIVSIEGDGFKIRPGDFFVIHKNNRHFIRATSTKPLKLLTILSP